jgi:hypothetical protein
MEEEKEAMRRANEIIYREKLSMLDISHSTQKEWEVIEFQKKLNSWRDTMRRQFLAETITYKTTLERLYAEKKQRYRSLIETEAREIARLPKLREKKLCTYDPQICECSRCVKRRAGEKKE